MCHGHSNETGISAEIGGYRYALFDYPLFWIFWLVESVAIVTRWHQTREQIERVIPKIGIVDLV